MIEYITAMPPVIECVSCGTVSSIIIGNHCDHHLSMNTKI